MKIENTESAIPLLDVVSPNWFVMNNGMINKTAYIIKLLNKTDRLAFVKVELLNSAKSMIGCCVRFSLLKKAEQKEVLIHCIPHNPTKPHFSSAG